MAQFEGLHGFGRSEPQDADDLPIKLWNEARRQWKTTAGALIFLATLAALIALSLSGPDFAENIVAMG